MLILEWIARLWLALAILIAIAIAVLLLPVAWGAEQILRLFTGDER